MKTQISRDGFRSEKRYSGVYQQQGRMITDADWNELVEIVKDELTRALIDVAKEGVPRDKGLVTQEGNVLKLKYGRVYANGVGALVRPQQPSPQPWLTNFNYTDQADYPSPPSRPPSPHVLYVDIWDRPLTSLEDEELKDPALHGADTTTRTQRMAQVKWCTKTQSLPCEDSNLNPSKGDATLKAEPRQGTVAPDPCDDCAEEVAPDSLSVGNYLFRLEVHDVKGPANNPTSITLKWSSENGAEEYAASSLPKGFEAAKYVYELYDAASQKRLGVDLSGQPVARPTIVSTLQKPIQLPYVRRWDGGCTLTRSGNDWTLATQSPEPRDAGTALSPQAPVDTHGRIEFSKVNNVTELKANLSFLKIGLQLTGKRFVAGDYWLVLVREREVAQEQVRVLSNEPIGITHHYLTLGSTKQDLVTLDLDTTTDKGADAFRRLTFPSLSDLWAANVRYNTECNKPDDLFAGVKTVQEALKRLCGLKAKHVDFDPTCKQPGDIFQNVDTVEEALQAICALKASHVDFDPACKQPGDIFQNVDTVEEALQAICALKASHIDFTSTKCGTDPGQLFKGVTTVEGALEALCDLKASHIDFTSTKCGTDPGQLFNGVNTVEDALEALCDLEAKQVSFDPSGISCDGLDAATNVAEALDILCARPSGDADVCTPILKLFGSGVLCGLIPTVTVRHRHVGGIYVIIRASDGWVVDGKGCVREVNEIEAIQNYYAREFTGGGLILHDLDEVMEAVATLRVDRDRLSYSERRMITEPRLESLREHLVDIEFADEDELARGVEEATGIADAAVVREIAAEIISHTPPPPDVPPLPRPRPIPPFPEPVPLETRRYLYLDFDDDGSARLILEDNDPDQLPVLDEVWEAVENPGDGPHPGDTTSCEAAHKNVWSAYSDVRCPTSTGEKVCLGTVGVLGENAWVVPDARQQVFPTPAISAQMWMRRRRVVYEEVKAICLGLET